MIFKSMPSNVEGFASPDRVSLGIGRAFLSTQERNALVPGVGPSNCGHSAKGPLADRLARSNTAVIRQGVRDVITRWRRTHPTLAPSSKRRSQAATKIKKTIDNDADLVTPALACVVRFAHAVLALADHHRAQKPHPTLWPNLLGTGSVARPC